MPRADPGGAPPARLAHEPPVAPGLGGEAVEPAPSLLESLVAGAVGGDPAARERLLAEIHTIVLRYCRARLGRQESVLGSADDVAQEVCLAVVNALPGYTLRGLSFRAFVYGIAAHKVTDAFRAIGRNRADPVGELPDVPQLADGPEHRLLHGELSDRLGALLDRLTSRQREVLVLRIAVGLSAEETAQLVGSTPGAVRVTQHRALNRLRRMLAAPVTDAAPDVVAEPDDPGPDDCADDCADDSADDSADAIVDAIRGVGIGGVTGGDGAYPLEVHG